MHCRTLVVCVILLSGAAAVYAERLELGDLDIPVERLPGWRPGIEGGIPEVPVRVDARHHGARGDGERDDAPAIQAAIDAVEPPGAVFLPEGTYLLKGTLRLRSGVVLRGAGPEKTRLRAEIPGEHTPVIDIQGRGAGQALRDLPLKSGFEAGSSELVLEEPADLRPGQYVELYCDNDPELLYTRREWDAAWAQNVVGQVLRVKAVRGTTLELDRPLRLSYRAELRPRITVFDAIERAGVEDLLIRRANDKLSYIVHINRGADCWVRNCHSEYCVRAHVWIRRSRGIVVRDSLMHHAHEYGGGGHGYGVVAGRWATDCLIENNVFDHLRHAMMTKEGANGNVFGYNASYRCTHNCDISVHGHYSYMNLFEGNTVQRIVYADWWGPTGPYTTSFRNRVENAGLNVGGPAISVLDHSHDANILLNTLVRRGVRVTGGSRRAHVEKNLFLGAEPSGSDALTRDDPPPDWELPASLYLAGRPDWWGERPWPAIGADIDLRTLNAGEPLQPTPAEERYREYKRTSED